VLKKLIGQGRLRADQDANLELWDADDRGECIWCSHPYSILTYRWNGSRLAQVRRAVSCRKIDPNAMTDEPIEGAAHSLEVEHADADESRQRELSKRHVAHRQNCDPRDPTRQSAKLATKSK